MKQIFKQALELERLTDEGCFILQNWGLPQDAGLSIARARLPVGGRTRWHRLGGVREFYLITAGRGLVEVGQASAEEVSPGDLVCIPAGQRQRIAQVGREELVFYCICTPAFTQEAYEDMEEPGAEEDRS